MQVSGVRLPRSDEAAHGHGSQADDAAADAGVGIVVRGFEVVDVLRHFAGIDGPAAGLVNLLRSASKMATASKAE